MSMKELKEAHEKNQVIFGIKEALKFFNPKNQKEKTSEKTTKKKTGRTAKKDAEQKKANARVFVASDSRHETLERLESAGINFEVLKNKAEISKELSLDFESEVFLERC